ncbi:hypothetical protein F0U60_20300 [Archangium minus]|uniref:Right handed beta helix domain-containing protein n=1 Tax=Archangium minus TaxID=83450 RepID=A0ABY9WTR1_9BACT|nr:hypothetical protein F0U60_20300 [Archangium minus]
MGSDRARNTYDEHQQYRSVVAQQGRVVIEADLNEAQEIASEELRAETLDFVGPAGTPTPVDGSEGGYAVSLDDVPDSERAFNFVVKPGTMYVGGLRVTRPDTLSPFDTTYWGQKNTEWVDGPVFEPPDASVWRELIYLHLSEREVSAVEDAALRDVALGGPDTSQRTRLTQHIVRLGVSDNTTTCQEALEQARKYWENQGQKFDPATMRLMPTARLLVELVPPEPGKDSACEPAAQASYLGAENQLIRVQVSDQGNKLLWGYDNGSHLYRVDLLDEGRKVKLKTSPVDDFHFPREGQVVELLRAAVRLDNGQYTAAPTGLTFKLGTNPYEPNDRLLTLSDEALSDLYLDKDSTPALFVRIWEDELDPGFESPSLLGQTGLRVSAQGLLVPGDYWMVAVRPSTPQQLYPARYLDGPQFPDGPRQWACPLALLEWDDGEGTVLSDCRPPFDNLVELTARVKALEERPVGGGCCSVTVTPEDAARLQEIIDKLVAEQRRGSITLCFRPGRYGLHEPLRLSGWSHEFTLEGCRGAVLTVEEGHQHRFLDGLIVLEQVGRVTIRGLELRLVPFPFAKMDGASLASLPLEELRSRGSDQLGEFIQTLSVGIGIRLVRTTRVLIEDCQFDTAAFIEGPFFSAGIFANDTCTGLEVLNNQFLAAEPPEDSKTPEWQRMSFGYLHTPSTSFLPDTPPYVPLTRETKIRGTLAAPRLDDATFRGNRFSNLSAAIFLQADPGTLHLEANQVRNGYAGFWLMTLHASAYAGVTDSDEVNRRRTFKELQELLPNSDMLPFMESSAFWEFYEAGLALLTDTLVLVASTLARGYPLPAGSKELPQEVKEAVAGSFFIVDSVRYLSLLAAQAVSWIPQVSDIVFSVPGGYEELDFLFGPLHRLLAAIEKQTDPPRPSQVPIHVSDNSIEMGRDTSAVSTAALTVWDAEKLPSSGPLPTTWPTWSLLVSTNRLRTRSFVQPAARILNVEQSTVTGNISHNRPPPTGTSTPTPWSFLLVPTKVAPTATALIPAATAITGNVFLGQAALPVRKDFPSLPWAQLNTVRFF